MALPLVWLGAAAIATYAGVKYSSRLNSEQYGIAKHPGQLKDTATPKDGSVVCCEVYSVFDHTGIWVDGRIVELNGNGLVRTVSPERFLHERSGDTIYVACNHEGDTLVEVGTADRAMSSLYQYREYDLLKNNCHTFVWQTIGSTRESVSRFRDLNQKLFHLHGQDIAWMRV